MHSPKRSLFPKNAGARAVGSLCAAVQHWHLEMEQPEISSGWMSLLPRCLAPKIFSKIHQFLTPRAYWYRSVQHWNSVSPAVNYSSHFPIHSYTSVRNMRSRDTPGHLKLYDISRVGCNSSGSEFVLGIGVTRALIVNRFSCDFMAHITFNKTFQTALTLLVESARVRQVWLGIDRLEQKLQGESA